MDVYELSKKLESKGFKVFYTNTIAETRGLLTELIGRTDTVGAGGSATLDEIGIGEALKERGNTVYIRRLMPDVNPDEVMKKAVFADWFLTSTSAYRRRGIRQRRRQLQSYRINALRRQKYRFRAGRQQNRERRARRA